MKKPIVISVIAAGLLLLGVVGGATQQPSTSNSSNTQTLNTTSPAKEEIKVAKPVCDGTIVTSHCAVDGVNYTSYTYQPAVAEKSHTETITTYREEVTSTCTLCNDGTYSPSCATGKGACSHHGGVAQWNAPRSSKVPEYTTKIVVDAPAQEAYYKKVVE